MENVWKEGSNEQIAKTVYNDLAFALRDKFPILSQGREDLLNCGAAAAEVSGSGPTLFAVFNSNEERDLCCQKLIELGYSSDKLIATSAG